MLRKYLLCLLALCAAAYAQATVDANDEANANANGGRGQTMKQLARGTLFAAASMSPQATLAAEHMLRDGGNAFDAIVAGQAVLGLMQPSLNGMGSDAVLLIYDAKAQKVWSLNAEGTAPKLATIEWYKTHQGGKIPVNDSLLSAHGSGRDGCVVHHALEVGNQAVRGRAGAGNRDGGARRADRRPRDECGRAAKVSHQHEAVRAAGRGALERRRGMEESRPGAHLAAIGRGGEAGSQARDVWPG